MLEKINTKKNVNVLSYVQKHDVINVHLYVFTEFTFDMDPLCIVHGHACLLLSMGIPASRKYHIFGKFPCLTCR